MRLFEEISRLCKLGYCINLTNKYSKRYNKRMSKKRKKNKMLSSGSEYWRTFKDCEHKPLILPKGYGILTGGAKMGDNISLFVGLDMYKYNLYDKLIDSYGVLRESIRQIYFPIEDLSIPTKNRIEAFEQVLSIVHGYLKENQNVHVNCMGGHGRTGLFLACYLGKYHKNYVNNNPVAYLREHYCKDAVETFTQHSFVADLTNTETPKYADYIITADYSKYSSSYAKSDYEVQTALAEYDRRVQKYQSNHYITTTSSVGKCRICEHEADNRIFLSNVGLICQFCWHDLNKINDHNKDKDINIETDRYAG